MWINLKCKYITRDGKSVRVNRGDPIPEAEFWPNRDRLARTRFIRWIPDAETPKAPAIEIEKKPEKEVVEVSESEEEKPITKKRGRPKKMDD